jgi:hypothetical protein
VVSKTWPPPARVKIQMAQVHPSRAGFIPREEPPVRDRNRTSRRDHSRSRSPRREERRSRSPERKDGRRSSPPHLNSSGNRNSPSYDAYRAREASGEQSQNIWGRVPPPRVSATNEYTGGGGYAAQGGGWQKGGDYFEEYVLFQLILDSPGCSRHL